MGNPTKASKKRKISMKLAPLLNNDIGIEVIKKKRSYFSVSSSSLELTPDEEAKRSKRRNRFIEFQDPGPASDQLPSPLLTKSRTLTARSHEQLVGENLCLEKQYLRLTTFPRKEDVRPPEVLVKSLAHIKSRYILDEDFEWANEQLKSLRQDLTVQRIRSPFVLDVYETHARILLEHGDLDEFNQCQTVIHSLVEGSNHTDDLVDAQVDPRMRQQRTHIPLRQSPQASDEFHAYGILYALVRNSRIDLKRAIARGCSVLTFNGAYRASTEYGILVVKSVEANDYRTFFRLYESAPHMSAYLMDFLVKRVRDRAYQRIISAFRPNVSVEHVREWLCFEDIEGARQFVRQNGAVFIEEKGEPPFWIDCKASVTAV